MELNEQQIEAAAEAARKIFGNGLHCAEAVVQAVLETLGMDASSALKCSTPFGGGFGKTHEEACGALTGGMIALGQVTGRCEPKVNWDEPAALGAALRTAFVEQFGITRCKPLRDRFGKKQMDECRIIVGEMTAETLRLINRRTKS